MPSQNIINRLQEVKKHILENPSRLLMSDWYIQDTPGTKVKDVCTNAFLVQEIPSCGTVGCIKGWLQHFEFIKNPTKARNIEILFAQELHIDKLFYVSSWIEPYQSRYIQSKTVEEKAQVCADYIDYVCTGAIDLKKKEV